MVMKWFPKLIQEEGKFKDQEAQQAEVLVFQLEELIPNINVSLQLSN